MTILPDLAVAGDAANGSSLVDEEPCHSQLWVIYNCPVTNPDPCCFPDVSVSASNWKAVLSAVVAVIGICGNLMTLVALPYARKRCHDPHSPLMNSTTVLVINLSVSDLIHCITLLCISSIFWRRGWPHGHASCFVIAFFANLAAFASLACLGAIALNRCLALWCPRVCTILFDSWRGIPPLLTCWVFAIVQCLVVTVNVRQHAIFHNASPNWSYRNTLNPADDRFMIRIDIVLPLFLMVISSVLVVIKVRQSRMRLKSIPDVANPVEQQCRERERKLTVLFLIMCVCYIICNGPLYLYLKGWVKYWSMGSLIVWLLFWTNFALNFFIYAFRVSAYREAYVEVLSKCACRVSCTRTLPTSH